MNFCIRAGKEDVARIRKVNFGQKCASSSVDRFGASDDLSRKLLTRKFIEHDICLGRSWLNASRIFLRNIHVHTHGAGLGDVKQISLRVGTAPGIDQVTDVGVSRGDHSIEWRIYLFER